jgi:hypothetical protein
MASSTKNWVSDQKPAASEAKKAAKDDEEDLYIEMHKN